MSQPICPHGTHGPLPHRMARRTRPLVSLLVALACGSSLAGTAVHRCTDAQGRVQYRQTPCPEQGQVLSGLGDARTRAQQREAEVVAERDHQLAQRMTADRRALERQAAHMDVQSLSPTAAGRPRATKPVVDPHAPVTAYRCRPPQCYEARVPRPAKSASAPTTPVLLHR